MTNIQWTDVTDNPIVVEGGGWWCQKVSEGCANCYAEAINKNTFFGGNHKPYTGSLPKLELKRDLIASWRRMRTPKKHFVSSMTDIFGDWVPVTWQLEILGAMVDAPKQTFQVLTKRPQIMVQTVNHFLNCNNLKKLPPNIWVGTSVENQKWANIRIPFLLRVPAQIKFLSVEPLLDRVCLDAIGVPNWKTSCCFGADKINWVIVGGELGKNARPSSIKWIEDIVDDCNYYNVPVFVKQIGSKSDWKTKHKKGGDFKEFPQSLKFQQFPTKEHGCPNQ